MLCREFESSEKTVILPLHQHFGCKSRHADYVEVDQTTGEVLSEPDEAVAEVQS